MIQNITKGGNFIGAVNYIMDDRKNAKLIYSEGVRTKNNNTIAQSFISQAKMNPNLTKNVGHISLSFAPQDADKVSDDFMVRIAIEYLKRLGIKNTQVIIGRHFDHDHPHCHILFNRINNDGNTISESHDIRRGIKVCKELTYEYNLYISKGKQNINENRLKEPDKTKYKLYSILKRELPHCKCWNVLMARLKEKGIETDFKYKGHTSEIQGVTFIMNGYHFKGSAIDHSMSYNKINELLKFNSQHENENYSNNTNATGKSSVYAQDVEQEHVDDVSSGFNTAKTFVEIPEEMFSLFLQGKAQDEGVSSGELPKKKKKKEDYKGFKR